MSESVYQHYLPSERDFIDKCLDWIRQVNEQSTIHCTYFLNPRERAILSDLASSTKLHFFAQPTNAESQKVLLAPDDYEPNKADCDLALIEVNFAHKFGQLSHRQILGSLLNETGLDRREVGDILVADEKAQFYVSQRLVEHFITTIHKIAGMVVSLKEVDLTDCLAVVDDSVVSVILASSLRLDKIIAASLAISRNLAANMIQSGQIKVNYGEVTKSDHLLLEGDMVSVRGYGRVKIRRLLGKTKKDKMKIEISTMLSHKGR